MSDRADSHTHQDFTGAGVSAEPEAPMCAATPVYARQTGRKRRGLRPAAAPPAEPRSFAEPTATLAEPATGAATDTGLGTVGARRPSVARRKSTGVSSMAIAGGAVALAAVVGVAVLAVNSGDAPVTAPPAAAPMAVVAPATPGPMADATPLTPAAPPEALAPTTAAVEPPARSPRLARAAAPVRPAEAAPSATDEGLDASAAEALPPGPQPYSSLVGAAAAAPPALNVPPVDSAPADQVTVSPTATPEPAAADGQAPDPAAIP